jgi:LPXTG-motif cell wall-anchored protein
VAEEFLDSKKHNLSLSQGKRRPCCWAASIHNCRIPARIVVMDVYAHNGHDHTEEMAQAAGSNMVFLMIVGAVVLLAVLVGLVLLLKRKKLLLRSGSQPLNVSSSEIQE